jgi:hypothetical protein
MKNEGIYQESIQITERERGRVFAQILAGKGGDLCLPKPMVKMTDLPYAAEGKLCA